MSVTAKRLDMLGLSDPLSFAYAFVSYLPSGSVLLWCPDRKKSVRWIDASLARSIDAEFTA